MAKNAYNKTQNAAALQSFATYTYLLSLLRQLRKTEQGPVSSSSSPFPTVGI